MTLAIPPRRCFRDGCHEFTPEAANHIYCTNCGCKRKAENARKRLTVPVLDTHTAQVEKWQLQEARKFASAVEAAEKNDYLWTNKRWGFFDIETSNLQASIGTMLSASIKEKNGPTVSYALQGFRPGDPWRPQNDGEIVELIRNEVEKYDYVVTYYGSRFDIPYIQTRLLNYGMRPLDNFRHWDLFYVPKFRLKLHSNRLDAVTEFMYGKTEKTRVIGDIWNRAMRGDAEAMEYIVEHCERDVSELEKVATDLRGFSNLSAIRLHHYGSSL